MARLHEYQGKQLLKEAGVATPRGAIAANPEQAREIANSLGTAVVVKAQMWSTGRFKAGGIRFADTPQEAERASGELLGQKLRGLSIPQVLVEERLQVEKEFYGGIIVDASATVRSPVVIFSPQGGVDLEEINPQFISTDQVSVFDGLQRGQAVSLLSKQAIPSDLIEPLSSLLSLYTRFSAAMMPVRQRSTQLC